ncbi:hypothetical protein Q1695_015094 [Nippostrongylus brasiliensis]|nr:hypothetical protein Q1695_015094 [Nippostrongylus brasiliensis]
MWQRTYRKTLRDRSPKLIGLLLCIAFAALLTVGTIYFPNRSYRRMYYSKIRDEVIANYSEYIYEHQKEVNISKVINSVQQSLRDALEPTLEEPRKDAMAIFNVMLGIRENLIFSNKLTAYAFIFASNVITFLIVIVLCFGIDETFKRTADPYWTFESCPPRDIVLDFRDVLKTENNKQEATYKVCSLDTPLPPESLRAKLLWPIRCSHPGFKLMLCFLIFTTAMTLPLILVDKDGFFDEFDRIVNYSTTTSPFELSGSPWDYVIWVFAFLDLILLNYTVYSLALIVLDFVFHVAGVKKDFNPILL